MYKCNKGPFNLMRAVLQRYLEFCSFPFEKNRPITFHMILFRALKRQYFLCHHRFELRFDVFGAVLLKYRQYIERELSFPAGVSNRAIITAELGERLIKVTSIKYG